MHQPNIWQYLLKDANEEPLTPLISPFYSSSPSNYSPCVDSPLYQTPNSNSSRENIGLGSTKSSSSSQAFFGPTFNGKFF